jgi:hypothetical protein
LAVPAVFDTDIFCRLPNDAGEILHVEDRHFSEDRAHNILRISAIGCSTYAKPFDAVQIASDLDLGFAPDGDRFVRRP